MEDWADSENADPEIVDSLRIYHLQRVLWDYRPESAKQQRIR